MLDISVVVCARNAARTLDACLRSIQRSGPVEIIVIDNGSVDDTAGIARTYTESVYPCEASGLAALRQFGLEKATRPYVSFIDSDVILPESTLSCMLKELVEQRWAGIHAQVKCAVAKTYWQRAEDNHFDITFNRPGERDSLITMAGIFRKDVILQYGFDPFFTGASEDGDLFLRVRRDGHTLGISSAFVYHEHRPDMLGFLRQRYGYGKGSARYFWKHRSAKALFGPSLMAGYGCLACLRQKSPKLLPYYLTWSLAANAGLMRGLWGLVFGRTVRQVVQSPEKA